jgi:hypothetical protein
MVLRDRLLFTCKSNSYKIIIIEIRLSRSRVVRGPLNKVFSYQEFDTMTLKPTLKLNTSILHAVKWSDKWISHETIKMVQINWSLKDN